VFTIASSPKSGVLCFDIRAGFGTDLSKDIDLLTRRG